MQNYSNVTSTTAMHILFSWLTDTDTYSKYSNSERRNAKRSNYEIITCFTIYETCRPTFPTPHETLAVDQTPRVSTKWRVTI
ncbi:hypothetical protein M8J76_008298 [Diaphorina citri]|nr:hypothetical protein M8J76_008298 [Diaphorina citri]